VSRRADPTVIGHDAHTIEDGRQPIAQALASRVGVAW
jgi:hypothetical protein